jgi:hypothetical protein
MGKPAMPAWEGLPRNDNIDNIDAIWAESGSLNS